MQSTVAAGPEETRAPHSSSGQKDIRQQEKSASGVKIGSENGVNEESGGSVFRLCFRRQQRKCFHHQTDLASGSPVLTVAKVHVDLAHLALESLT